MFVLGVLDWISSYVCDINIKFELDVEGGWILSYVIFCKCV